MNAFMRIKFSMAALLAGTVPALADPAGNGECGFGHMMWGGDHGIWGPIGMIVFWGLIIAVAVFAFRTLGGLRGSGERDAMDVLKERYARGEIDNEEFRRRKQELQS